MLIRTRYDRSERGSADSWLSSDECQLEMGISYHLHHRLATQYARFSKHSLRFKTKFYAIALYCFCFCYESLPDEILRQKAKYLRQRTGDPRWSAPKEHVPLGKLFKTAFTKVIIMFFTEPLVTFTTIYLR